MNVSKADTADGIRVSYPYSICLKCDPGKSRHLEVHLTKKDVNGRISSDIICLREDQPVSLNVPQVKTLDL